MLLAIISIVSESQFNLVLQISYMRKCCKFVLQPEPAAYSLNSYFTVQGTCQMKPMTGRARLCLPLGRALCRARGGMCAGALRWQLAGPASARRLP